MIRCLVLSLLFQPSPPSYATARAEALRTGRPLVIGVGCCAPAGDWLLVCVPALEGFEGPCVVVSQVSHGKLWWNGTLPPDASAVLIGAGLPYRGPRLEPAPAKQPSDFPKKKWGPYTFAPTVSRATC